MKGFGEGDPKPEKKDYGHGVGYKYGGKKYTYPIKTKEHADIARKSGGEVIKGAKSKALAKFRFGNGTRSYPMKNEVSELRKSRGSFESEHGLSEYRRAKSFKKASGTTHTLRS